MADFILPSEQKAQEALRQALERRTAEDKRVTSTNYAKDAKTRAIIEAAEARASLCLLRAQGVLEG